MIAATTETTLVLLQLGAVLLVMAVLGALATRLRISTIPLFLLTGLLIGQGGLVPIATAEEFIEIGAEIGVILLLLLLGVDYSGDELSSSLKTNWPVGLTDAALNFTPGFVAGLILGFTPLGSAFLGGITYISSSGIIAKLLSDVGWIGNRETPVVLSVLVMEDLAMAAYLPVVTALTASAALLQTAGSIALAFVLVAVVLVVATRYGHQVSELLLGRTQDPELILLAVLGVTFVAGALAEQVRISAAVAAFLVGIVISGEAADRVRVVLAPIRDLFAAVFFLFFGLQVDLGEVPPVLVTAVVLAVATATTKIGTGWIGGTLNKVSAPGRWRAGLALVARGEFSIVIAELAILAERDARVGALATTYVLILAFCGPIAVYVLEGRQNRAATEVP